MSHSFGLLWSSWLWIVSRTRVWHSNSLCLVTNRIFLWAETGLHCDARMQCVGGPASLGQVYQSLEDGAAYQASRGG